MTMGSFRARSLERMTAQESRKVCAMRTRTLAASKNGSASSFFLCTSSQLEQLSDLKAYFIQIEVIEAVNKGSLILAHELDDARDVAGLFLSNLIIESACLWLENMNLIYLYAGTIDEHHEPSFATESRTPGQFDHRIVDTYS